MASAATASTCHSAADKLMPYFSFANNACANVAWYNKALSDELCSQATSSIHSQATGLCVHSSAQRHLSLKHLRYARRNILLYVLIRRKVNYMVGEVFTLSPDATNLQNNTCRNVAFYLAKLHQAFPSLNFCLFGDTKFKYRSLLSKRILQHASTRSCKRRRVLSFCNSETYLTWFPRCIDRFRIYISQRALCAHVKSSITS